MNNSLVQVPPPKNEPVLSYAPGSPEKKTLKEQLQTMAGQKIEIPLFIGGREVRGGKKAPCILPHDHQHVIAEYHLADAEKVQQAIDAALAAQPAWAAMDWAERAAIFLRAAELLAGRYRAVLNAATMLNQSKTVYQAEIDSACELIDFWRFNPYFMAQIFSSQPQSAPGVWNRLDYRPLEGFTFAVTPFNFTSIAGNLPTSMAMMGNVVLWKPASTAVYSAHFIMKLLQEAGLPDGVINLIPGPGKVVGDLVVSHPALAGIHFTGSTSVFQDMWRTVGNHIERYRSYPRIVGETGGKDFVFAHPSADVEELAVALVRGAFEYQGQKCSAASRAYIPQSLWKKLEERLRAICAEIKMGDVGDFSNFVGAVIDRKSFQSLAGHIEAAKKHADAEVLIGGRCDDRVGFFIEPTVILARDPLYTTMQEELFGPILTLTIYPDKEYEKTLALCDRTSPYALTGSIFARDRQAVVQAERALRNAAGNFYINDKPTGAVVGQQPFGGGRASGTNDKAGSYLNLVRWLNPRTVKETFSPPCEWRYPHQAEK